MRNNRKLPLKKAQMFDFFIDAITVLSLAFFPSHLFSSTEYALLVMMGMLYQALLLLILFPKVYKKISRGQWLIIASLVIPIISTLIMGNIKQLDFGVRIFLAYFTIIVYSLHRTGTGYKIFIKNSLIVWGILLAINSITIFAFKQTTMYGRKDFYFLGNDNATIFESFIFIIYSAYLFIKVKKRIPIPMYILYGLLFLTYLYAWSGNALSAVLAMIIIMAFRKTLLARKMSARGVVLVACSLFFLLFIVYHTQGSLTTRLLDMLGKDYTYTGRTVIWDKMTPYIAKHPILGNGYNDYNDAVQKFGFNKAHNYIIQTAYTGGYTQLALVILGSLMIINNFYKNEKSKQARTVVMLSIIVFFIINSFDYDFERYSLVYLLSMLCHGNRLKIGEREPQQ